MAYYAQYSLSTLMIRVVTLGACWLT